MRPCQVRARSSGEPRGTAGTDDELIMAVREHVASWELPAPASAMAVSNVQETVGHPMPQLLRRLYLEVANGGFGPGAWCP